jgi:Putative prokaryotic signal transducing protein
MSDLVKIETYFDVMQAQLAKSKLEAYGIYCFLQDENLVQTDWLRTIAYGGVKLFVREADVQQALELLSEGAVSMEDETFNEN